ncbi:MAG: flavin reductase [Bacilli bacterium]|nr:flavin reductase [Bacilli bacterium]
MNDLSQQIYNGCLLTAGPIDDYNTMTIGWGMIGTLWGKEVFMCFVRPTRYTYEFMERHSTFTISFYNTNFRQEMSYLGTRSGKNTSKVADVHFEPIAIGDGVTFKQAYQTLVCKKIYHQDMDASQFPEAVLKTYYSAGGIHRLYVGEVIRSE